MADILEKMIIDKYCIKSYSVRSSYSVSLTHLPLDKMAAISQTIFSDACVLINEKFCILVKISRKFVPKGTIDNNPALV